MNVPSHVAYLFRDLEAEHRARIMWILRCWLKRDRFELQQIWDVGIMAAVTFLGSVLADLDLGTL